jgi:hypothetical protein
MHNVTVNLYECLHCKGEGTCRNAENGASCAVCIKRNELRGKSYSGLICGSCGGIGKAEPFTERLNKRMGPLLALVLVVGLLFMVSCAALFKSTYFSEILTFASTIIGLIVGFYFSTKAMKL